jgi:hypothetical protein
MTLKRLMTAGRIGGWRLAMPGSSTSSMKLRISISRSGG